MADQRHLLHEVAGGRPAYGEWRASPDRTGAPTVPTVLAVHGITAHHLAFAFLAQELAGEARLLAPDLRGRGRSRDLPGPWGMATHADDCAALLAEVGTGPVTVVGHSMGAFVAVVLAHRHPGLVSSLVLVDGGLPLTPSEVAATDAVIAVIRERLAQEFPDRAAYRAVFEQHPGLRHDWAPEIAAYADHDLVGEPPHLRPATLAEAVVADQDDVSRGEALPAAWAADRLAPRVALLHAPRGLLDEPPGIYSPASLVRHRADRPEIEEREVPGTNHYTIVMSPRGAAEVGRTVREHLRDGRCGSNALPGRVGC